MIVFYSLSFCKKNVIFLLYFLSFSLFAEAVKQTTQPKDSEEASSRAVYSKRHKLYYPEKPVNDVASFALTKKLDALEKKMLERDATSETAGEMGPADFMFKCPGDSFLVGLRSLYKDDPENHHQDRYYNFVCAFFENEKGELLKKQSCGPEGDFKLANFDHKPKEDWTSKCSSSTTPLHGLMGKYFINDRIYKSLCCNLQTWSKKNYKTEESACTVKKFSIGEKIDFLCGGDMVITQISGASYTLDKKDRNYSVTCCPMKT